MKKILRFAVPVFVFAMIFGVSASFAITGNFVASQTTASVSSSAIPAIIFADGADEVKAERTLSVGAVPADGETVTIGSCVVDFDSALSDELNCVDNLATVDTASHADALGVASALQNLFNVSDASHGTLSVSGSGTDAIFTTANTEASTTEIFFADGTSGDIVSGISVLGIVPAVASATITIPGGLTADATDHSITIDGVNTDLGTSALTANEIATAISANPFTGKDYAVTNPAGADLTFTKSTAGFSGNGQLTIDDENYGAVAQTVTFTPSSVTAGETYRATVNGTIENYLASSGSVDAVVSALAPLMDANPAVACSEDDTQIICTAESAGTGFTYDATVVDVTAPEIPTIDQSAQSVKTATVHITGTAEADSIVEISGGASVASTTATGGNYDIEVTLTPNALNNLSVTATDTAVPSNTSGSAVVAITADNISPVVVLSSSAPSGTNTVIPVTASFSEAVSGFSLGDISVGNGTASNLVSVNGAVYTFDVTPSADGPVTVDVASASAQDVAGNGNTSAVQLGRIYDHTPPTVVSLSFTPNSGHRKIGDTVTLNITADAPGYTEGAITINGIAVTDFASAGGNNYTALYTVVSGDTDRPIHTVPASVILTDATGNSNVAHTTIVANSLSVDAHAPILLSAQTTSTTTIDLSFSEVLNGATVNSTGTDFTVAGFTISHAAKIATSSVIVRLTVSTPFATNAVPNVSYVGSVKDSAGNMAPNAGPITPTDGVLPILSSVAVASNNASSTLAKVGDTVTTSFTASESVGTPTATISGHTATISGGPTNWSASYAMVSGDAEGAVSFTVNFTDLSGNVGAPVNSVTNGSSVTFDKTPPVITVAPYILTPINTDLTVNAVTNEGALNFASNIFTANGSFDFVATDLAGNVTTQTVTITNIDKTAPVISLTGASPITIEVHSTYADLGATALDNYDGVVTSSIVAVNLVNQDVVGDYTVTYNVVDTATNHAVQVSRTVRVVDTTAPIITLNGNGTINLAINNPFIDPGATTTDNYDSSDAVVVARDFVNTSVAGVYHVTYDATDVANNHAIQRARTVAIFSATLPLATTTNLDGSLSGVVPSETLASTTANGVSVAFSIPAGVTITATSTWDGTLSLPTATTTFTAPAGVSGFTTSVLSAVEIGASNTPLAFDKGVRIVFAGQAGKLVGWSQGGAFTATSAICSADTQSVGDALANGGDCKIDSGLDLVVWTKHFTTFVTYSRTAIPVPVVVSGGGSNGPPGGLIAFPSSGNPFAPAPVATVSVVSAPQISAPSVAPQGQVLGASTYNFTQMLTVGSRGDDVSALQNFLAKEGFYKRTATGYFGPITAMAVEAYQTKQGISSTGVVGALTRAQLNKGAIATAPAKSVPKNESSQTQTASVIASIQDQIKNLTAQVAELQAKLKKALGQ